MEKIYVVCSGWYYKEWKGIFYPDTLKEKDFFSFYADNFNTVEINSSFYHFPLEKVVQKWYVQAPKNFKYSLKVPRSITHYKEQSNTLEILKRFYGLSNILKEKTGCFLFQFPRSFFFTEKNLEKILSYIDKKYTNIVEFRHPSWWTQEVLEALHAESILLCTVSGFPVPEELSPGKEIYIRFHGDPSYKHLYTRQELYAWSQKIRKTSFNTIWAYFNNTVCAHAPFNALQLQKILRKI